ncbi:MAG: tRNA pseudouridine(38-40) synthase TruA [Crocinitomicaceae bacterium]|nr:tRNA pseudouridine(38-40) synthase TruA [Crocinitomicaceae bacterium]
MARYFLKLSYKGTSYCGWQKQPSCNTVQEELEKAIGLLLGKKTEVVGCGRTDTGVHAHEYYAHFEGELDFSLSTFEFRLNGILPNDMAIQQVFPVTGEAHARFDAISRTYRYYINYLKDPFSTDSSHYLYNTKLDLGKMNEAADYLTRVNDFSSFEKVGSDNKTSICKVHFAEWFDHDKGIYFEIRADRFLRNMVRAIVGTLIEVGKGNINQSEFEEIIEEKNRSKAGVSVPAKGLFLWELAYPLTVRL